MARANREILQFLMRTLLLALAVMAPFVIAYVWADPFKVLRHYDGYFEDPARHPARIGLNKGVVTVNTYNDNLRRGIRYNAFIFGSSISCYYDAYEWRDLLMARGAGDVVPVHFDSSAESVMSMDRKVRYLYRTGAPLDYALIVLDPIILQHEDSYQPFVVDPVEFNDDRLHYLKFHYTFFRAATNADFLKSIVAAAVTGRPECVGHNPVFEPQPIVHDRLVNQENLPAWDSLIAACPEQFYNERPLPPAAGHAAPGPPAMTFEKYEAFNRIADVFKWHHTYYQIIISPNREGVSLAPSDLETLQWIFGANRVHDFSAAYAADLKNDTLLYDKTHYRPPFASKLMRAVYTQPR